MGYLYLTINIFIATVCTVLGKISSNISKGKIFGVLFFTLIVAVFEIIIFSALNGFRLQFTWISFAFAAVYGFMGCLGTVVSLKAYTMGHLATYVIISTVGGIVIPFLFGFIVLQESAGICKWVGCAMMLVGVVIAQKREKSDNKEEQATTAAFLLLCFFGAFISGVSQCINKLQSVSEGVVDGNSYVVYIQTCIALCCIIAGVLMPKRVKLMFKETPQMHGAKIICVSGIYGLLGGISIVISLFVNKLLPAVVVFPISSGMSIVMSAIVGRVFFQEKITKVKVISTAIIVTAMVVLVLPF